MRRLFLSSMFTLALCLCGMQAGAQEFPSRPVRMIVPFAPGGATDLIGRILAQQLSQIWKQPVVVENHPGASGAIGWELVARSEPSGYVLLLCDTSFATVAALRGASLPYDSHKGFAHIAEVAQSAIAMAVNARHGAKTVQEFVSNARQHPGKLNLGSSGTGSSTHLSGELFSSVAGIDLLHVPYKGVSAALQDLVAGHVDTVFGSAASVVPLIESGRLRALMVASRKRSSALPDVPNAVEAHYPEMQASTWFGVSAPAGVPQAVRDRIYQAVRQAAQTSLVKEKLLSLGMDPVVPQPGEFERLVDEDIARWSRVVKQRNIKVE